MAFRKKQASVTVQLMCFLSHIGKQSFNASSSRDSFGIGYGTHYLYCNRVAEAITSLRDQAVSWPDEEERKLISARLEAEYDFPNCVGSGDGTLFPLASQPSTEDAPDYSGRKFKYSLTCFIINDDKRRIRAYSAGWPGSVHDNRVYGNMRVNKKHEQYFNGSEYILSDSALENSDRVVSAFKKPPAQPMPIENERFNTKLARLRILSEHTIGILKGRFPWLNGINMRITEDRKSMVRILKYIDCCIILHNLLIAPCRTRTEKKWIDEEEFSDIDDPSRAPSAKDRLKYSVNESGKKDERRRRLQSYFESKEYA